MFEILVMKTLAGLKWVCFMNGGKIYGTSQSVKLLV